MNRYSLVSVAALCAALAACSQAEQGRSSEDLSTYDSAERAAPGVDVTAAPGVAFNYRYAFRLPSNRISAVQEAHAGACEKLGLDRCRITGMRYRLVNQRDIEAMLALRLDPAIARSFGKQATEAVTRAEGMLVDQEITGEDVGTRIRSATRSETQLRSDLADLERQIAALGRNDARRGELTARAEEIRMQLRRLDQSRQGDEEALAGTPMVFNYGSGSVVPGFDVRSPVRDALQNAADNFVGGFSMILVLLVTLIPWALLLLLAVWLYRRFAARWVPQGSGGYRQEEDPIPAPTDTPPSRRRPRKSDG